MFDLVTAVNIIRYYNKITIYWCDFVMSELIDEVKRLLATVGKVKDSTLLRRGRPFATSKEELRQIFRAVTRQPSKKIHQVLGL